MLLNNYETVICALSCIFPGLKFIYCTRLVTVISENKPGSNCLFMLPGNVTQQCIFWT